MVEKEKEDKLYTIRLREFMQKNVKYLPLHTLVEIEDIMEGRQEEVSASGIPKSSRRMAPIYQKVKQIEEKREKEGEVLPLIDQRKSKLKPIAT